MALLSLLYPERDLQGANEFQVVASVCNALFSHGPQGVRALTEFLYSNMKPPEGISETARMVAAVIRPLYNVRRSDYVIRALWCAGRAAEIEATENYGTWSARISIDERTQLQARDDFDEMLAEARHNDLLHSAMYRAMELGGIRDDPGPNEEEDRALAALKHELATHGMLALSARMVRQFSALLQEDASEKAYQDFLAEYPVFLDPVAAEVMSQKPLGVEFKTDFVVRRHDYEYLVVEIEKPQDRIFTQKGDFTAPFFHAFGQVLEFQAWVDQHVAYAREHNAQDCESQRTCSDGKRPRRSSTGREAPTIPNQQLHDRCPYLRPDPRTRSESLSELVRSLSRLTRVAILS